MTKLSGNFTQVCYIGDRAAVIKEFNRRRYKFIHSKAVAVPDEFLPSILRTRQFVLADVLDRPLDETHPEGGSILMRRWGALGDLLMFRAAVSAFVRANPQFRPTLRCQGRFVSIFKHDALWADVTAIGERLDQFDGVYSFDQTAEADHRDKNAHHRVELFLQAMTRQPLKITPEDWQLPIPPEVTEWVRRHLGNRGLLREQRPPHSPNSPNSTNSTNSRLVAIQLRGSAAMKSLPRPVMARLMVLLSEQLNATVMIIEESPHEVASFAGDRRFATMTQRDALHGIAMLREADLAITMDSGALWMAHSAPCPVLCILGPTRPEQRMTAHPDYALGKARAVCLNKLIDCPACFEIAKACAGKYTCMQKQPDWEVATNLIIQTAQSMLNGDLPLDTLPSPTPHTVQDSPF